MGNACSCKITMDNKLEYDLMVTAYPNPLPSGKWDHEPATVKKQGSNSFKAISKTCSCYGVEGSVTYTIADGTKFKVQFSSPYGSSSPTCTCVADGVMAENYKVSVDGVSGRNISPTVKIEPAS